MKAKNKVKAKKAVVARKKTPEKVTRETADMRQELLDQLRAVAPEAFSEGELDLKKLKGLVGDTAEEGKERYSFTWAGKRDAIRHLQTPGRATLVPCPKESIDFDETHNVFIEGDNLEVLKLLYKSYFGRVKMIYIDPPYNTGNDFVYPDNFADPLETYLQLTGQKDANGDLVTSNPETSGRYHSAWLSMMYPRLFVARQLLREDGVIFVSIDDHEFHNLRLMMNEIFGEENYYGTIVWQKKDTPSNEIQGLSINHEYIVSYVRGHGFERRLLPRTKEQLKIFKNPDNDPRGPWTRTAMTRMEYVERDYYSIKNPKGREIFPPPGTSWRVSRETLKRLIEENRLWWGINNDGDMPFVKRFLSEVQGGVVPTSWWDYKFAGSTRNAKMEIRSLFDNEVPFETPKPSKLIQQLLRIATEKEDIVLDFFAGSSPTAQAVLELNREDDGNRQFIMVQLPEPTDRKNLSTIAEIGKERTRRVIKKLKDAGENELAFKERNILGALGFRVFKLTESNYKPWIGVEEKEPGDYAETMELYGDALVDGWKPENVIWEVAIKEGYGLNSRIEKMSGPKGYSVYRVTDPDKGQSFLICLDEKLKLQALKTFNLQKDDLFICRDSALDDETAANLALQCRLKVI